MLFAERPLRLKSALRAVMAAVMMLSSPALIAPVALHAQALPELGRDAARVGVDILNSGGFELNGMVNFFGHLQAAGRNRSENVPSYLMTHPLTTERIADIEGRIRSMPYRQRVDSLDFALMNWCEGKNIFLGWLLIDQPRSIRFEEAFLILKNY